MPKPDVVVIGAGAAGLFAAIHAAERGLKVVLLERNAKAGVKILASGGGRCNLTTTREGDALLSSFRPSMRRFLRPAFAALPPKKLRAWFEVRGVATAEEELEKVFPVAGRARVVVDALTQALQAAGAELQLRAPVKSLRREADDFVVSLEDGRSIAAAEVVLAVGGKSYPKTGTIGDGYPWVEAFGHRVVPTVPALAALITDPKPPADLAGLTLDHATVSAVTPADVPPESFDRPVLVTHRGLSGPGAMDVAGAIEVLGGGVVRVAPAGRISRDQAEAKILEAAREAPRRQLAEVLPKSIPQSFRRWMIERLGLQGDRTAATLTKVERRALAELLEGIPFQAPRSEGYDHAEVTRGGVDLDEVDPKTMASRKVPGLFLCGEILDVDGPIGGFNFQAAFATGYLAGLAVGHPRG